MLPSEQWGKSDIHILLQIALYSYVMVQTQNEGLVIHKRTVRHIRDG